MNGEFSHRRFPDVCPHDRPTGGPLVGYTAQESSEEKKHGRFTHCGPCFSLPAAGLCVPCGCTFRKENRLSSCFSKNTAPAAHCSQTEVWMSPLVEDVLRLSRLLRADRAGCAVVYGLNESRRSRGGFLLRGFRDNGFIHPPPSISFISGI